MDSVTYMGEKKSVPKGQPPNACSHRGLKGLVRKNPLYHDAQFNCALP
jgi:hypothetical protein